ncbi:hypothetical protein HY523_00020 [Candidatus Berkelbacteria bacterium]|nr:hypothetical protein [Candidatus Berkelbacteria bacterium]
MVDQVFATLRHGHRSSQFRHGWFMLAKYDGMRWQMMQAYRRELSS